MAAIEKSSQLPHLAKPNHQIMAHPVQIVKLKFVCLMERLLFVGLLVSSSLYRPKNFGGLDFGQLDHVPRMPSDFGDPVKLVCG
mgnify:CR=1 FL=1